MAAMLDFIDLMHITGQRKNDNIYFSSMIYSEAKCAEKSILTNNRNEKFF